MTIQMKATEQYFHVVLFIMLYKVVLTFEPGFKPKLSMIIQIETNDRAVVLFLVVYYILHKMYDLLSLLMKF